MEREEQLKNELEMTKKLAYGKCDNNAVFPDGLGSGRQQKEKMIQRMYTFTAAFENSISPCYALSPR